MIFFHFNCNNTLYIIDTINILKSISWVIFIALLCPHVKWFRIQKFINEPMDVWISASVPIDSVLDAIVQSISQ
ncbi:hypothetical protein MI1_04820 [Leuconostoc mesenteroides subsp. mesenteroides J18]|nr:hypothetical protein MI1_04820 [Leuconostoc mesenteroides subsp. mesenteroides J18]AQU49395.1 hypothetical protein ARA01_05065 [Leuconostoc mesenteroides subsp. mesenteroides]